MAFKNLAKLINQQTKIKPTHEKFLQELIQTIERCDKPRKPSRTYKPSSLGGCMRNLYFQVTGVEPDTEKRSFTNIGITKSGTDRHEIIQTYISKMKELGYDCEWVDVADFIEQRKPKGTKVIERKGMETKCANDILNISFLCDGLIKYDGVYYIIEIKTESLYKFQGQVQPWEEHISQAASYSVCLDVNKILFIYENRDCCDLKAYLVDITDKMKEEKVVGKINTCESYRERGEVPPKSDNKKDCTYCRYKTECDKW